MRRYLLSTDDPDLIRYLLNELPIRAGDTDDGSGLVITQQADDGVWVTADAVQILRTFADREDGCITQDGKTGEYTMLVEGNCYPLTSEHPWETRPAAAPDDVEWELTDDDAPTRPTHFACIGFTTATPFCELSVGDAVETGFAPAEADPYGAEVPTYGISTDLTWVAQLTVTPGEDDALTTAPDEADRKLTEAGWTRIGDWDFSDNAAYAPLIRAE